MQLRTAIWVGLLGGVALQASLPACAAAPTYSTATIAGNGLRGDLPPAGGPATESPVDQPFGVEMGPDGALYITSVGQHRLLRLQLDRGRISSVAGSGKSGYSGDGGPASEASLYEPYEVRFDRRGNILMVEMQNHLVRRIDARSGHISTVAGSPAPGWAGDGGPARAAQFRQPHSIALDNDDNLYVADIGNHRVRRIDARDGSISSIAGNGQKSNPPSGTVAKDRPLLGPRALAVVGRTLWIALREGHSVWRLDLDDGRIWHVAGTGQAGYSGDGGPARLATMNGPKGIAATTSAVYVVDSENHAIRVIDLQSGVIYTAAGGGPAARGFADDALAAANARFDRPHGIGLDADGGFYVGDTINHRVRWIRPRQPVADKP